MTAAATRKTPTSPGTPGTMDTPPPGDRLPAIDFARLGPPPGSRLLVAGGCGGIGRGLVAGALETGLEVAVMDLPASAERHPAPEGVPYFPLDATVESSVRAAFADLADHWTEFDALVNLIGYANAAIPLAELAAEDWDDVIGGNVRSAFLIAKSAMALLRERRGAMVLASSGLGFRGMRGYGPYTASKAAIVGMTKTLALENAPEVRVNAVAPGAVDTAFQVGGTGRTDDEDGPLRSDLAPLIKANPMGRIGVVDDIVGPILFLCGPAARWMSGQTLHINGGGFTP